MAFFVPTKFVWRFGGNQVSLQEPVGGLLAPQAGPRPALLKSLFVGPPLRLIYAMGGDCTHDAGRRPARHLQRGGAPTARVSRPPAWRWAEMAAWLAGAASLAPVVARRSRAWGWSGAALTVVARSHLHVCQCAPLSALLPLAGPLPAFVTALSSHVGLPAPAGPAGTTSTSSSWTASGGTTTRSPSCLTRWAT